MNVKKNDHNKANMLPVFRFDLENRLIYANGPAEPLMKEWNCKVNEKVPAEVVSHYPALFHAALSHRPFDLTVEFGNCCIHFSIVPFPEARYIGMYAYAMEANGKYTSAPASKTDVTTVTEVNKITV